jgi:streptogramin lyase
VTAGPASHKPHHFGSRSGFSLITAAVVLTVAAIVFVSMLPNKSLDQNLKIAASVNRLDRVEEAMRGFMAANGRRPCPADGSLAPNNGSWGKESINAGVCNITAGMMGPDTSGKLAAGLIPVTTLNLDASYAYDEYGRPYTYVVDTGTTVKATCQTMTTNNTAGGIAVAIKNTAGSVTGTDNTMAAYISGGKSGFGTYLKTGSTVANRLNTGSSDTDMLANAGVTANGGNWTYTAGGAGTFTPILVKKSPTTTFDQVVWYRPDLKNKCCLGASCGGGGGGGGNCNAPTSGTPAFSPSTITVAASPYPAWSAANGACTQNSLVCNADGTLTCNLNGGGTYTPCTAGGACTQCQNSSCSPTPPNCATVPGPLTTAAITPTMSPNQSTNSAWAKSTDLTCTSHTLLCTNSGGVLNCDGSTTLTNCLYGTCVKECACPAGWTCSGGGFSADGNVPDGGTVTAYQTATAAWPATCSSTTRTCTNGQWNLGSWGAGNTNQSCTQTSCQLSANQGGGWIATGTSAPGSFYPASSPSVCPVGNTLSCNNGTLSCSDGNIADCAYNSCTPTGGAATLSIWVTDTGNNKVQEFNQSGSFVTAIGNPITTGGQLAAPVGVVADSSGNLWVTDSGNQRVQKLNSSGSFILGIGSGYQGAGGSIGNVGAGNGQFWGPWGIAIDSSSNVWVAEYWNHRVQKFNSSGSFILTSGSNGVGNAQFYQPSGIAADSSGNVWVADLGNNRMQKLNSSGSWLQTVPGSGCVGGSPPACASGTGNGQFAQPAFIFIDGSGNLWVTEASGERVQTFNSAGSFLSKFGAVGAGNGQFNAPQGITIDSGGNIWVMDQSNNRVQKFNSSGSYLSQFGSFGNGNAQFSNARGVALATIVSGTPQTIWVTETGANLVEKYNSSGSLILSFGAAGVNNGQFSLTTNPPAIGISADSNGNIWVADMGNNRIQKFNSSGSWLQTVPGSGCAGGSPPACAAGAGNGQFSAPKSLTVDGSGNIWVTDTGNNRVQEFNASGSFVQTFGAACGHSCGNGQFNTPYGIAVNNSSGNVWVVDMSNYRVQEFNGSGSYITQFGGTKGSGNAQFNLPVGISVDSNGNVWVTDNNNARVQEFNSSGSYLSQFATSGGDDSVSVDSSNNIWVTNYSSNVVQEFNSSGSQISSFSSTTPQGIYVAGGATSTTTLWVADGSNDRMQQFNLSGSYLSQFGAPGTGQFMSPYGTAVDTGGNVFVVDASLNRVQEFNSSGSYVTQFGSLGSGNGQFNDAQGIATDSSNDIWVTDSGNSRVEEFNSAGSFIKTFGSSGPGNGQFAGPFGLAVDTGGNVWVADELNNRVEKLNSSGSFLLGIGSGYQGAAGSIGTTGTGNGQFNYPIGVTIDTNGNVWVSDSNNDRVQEFNSSGSYLGRFGSGPGAGNGQFNTAEGIAVDVSGNFWVVDNSNDRVEAFNSSGSYLSQFASPGHSNGFLYGPVGVGIYGTAPANCTTPWSTTLNSGYSVYAYNANLPVPPATCAAANTLSCNNGTLACNLSGGGTGPVTPNCQYQTCNNGCNLPWGGTVTGGGQSCPSGDCRTAYQAASVAYPTTCSSQNRVCTNGTLSGSYAFGSCTETGQPCNLPWGGSINDTQSVTAYQNATEAAAGSATCTSSQTRTCNNGVLSGTYTNQSCAVTCSLTMNQGGGVLYALIANGPTTATEYTASSAASCPSHTLTCAAAGLSCSTGLLSDCSYNSCTTSICPAATSFRIYGSAANVQAGTSVATGDVNGDGTTDLIIGAPGANAGAGAVYVVFGTNAGFPDPIALSSLNGTTGFVLNGSANPGSAGWSVAAGDVNGDGIADILIGAPKTTISANANVGSAYIVFGHSTAWNPSYTLNAAFLNGTNGVEYDGTAVNGGQFAGNSVAIGDINGDGKKDLIIGAYGVTIGGVQVNAGATYVIFGKAAGTWPVSATSVTTAINAGAGGFEVDGTVSGQDYGFSVASGDVNGDGVADLLIGGYGSNSTNGGFAVVFGGATKPDNGGGTVSWTSTPFSIGTTFLNGTNGALFSGAAPSDQTGWSIAAGDVNGDGKADIIVGSDTATYGGVNFYTGKVAIIFGKGMPWSNTLTTITSAWLNGTNGVEYDGPFASAYTGWSVASADVNGDGKSDLLIGSYNTGGGNGSAFIVFGMAAGWPSTPTILNAAYLNGTNGVEYDGGLSGGWLGTSIAAGDVNKDGMPDIVIGAPDASPSGNSKAGAVYTVFGRSSGCSSPGWPTTPTTLDPQAASTEILVADTTNNRVQKFNMSGSYVSQFGTLGVANGQFSGPVYTAVDSSGNIWVTDKGNNRIEQFNSSGSWVLTVPGSGCTNGSPPACTAGTGNGQFNQPSGASVDSSGNVWVVDKGNNRVEEFNSSGSFLQIVGGPCGHSCGNGQFSGPWGIAVDGGGNVWVGDALNYRVEEFNGSGSFILTFGSNGSTNGKFNYPFGIAADSSGNIWVADNNNERVQEFNSSGSYLSSFPCAGAVCSSGTGNGQFHFPEGVAFDSNGNIWVTDAANNRVQEFNSSGSYLSQFGGNVPTGGTGNGQFNTPQGIAIH